MTNSSSLSTPHQPTPAQRPQDWGVHQLPQPTNSLADRYRAACGDELALISTFYRHPVAARSIRPGALDHTISLPDADGVTSTIRTHRVRVPAGLVRDLSLRYPEYLMLGGQPVYLFTASVLVGLHDDHPTAFTRHAHARAIAEALHGARGAANIHPNGTDPASGAFRFSWIGDREGRVFTSPPELFTPRSRAA
ncbi:hypothetical protein [Corynebacterium xerosis]|uniref:hypothetical protein n=1 Tax=Corynebacterium xerosis TaxID=1725 RepID=UPI0038793B8D